MGRLHSSDYTEEELDWMESERKRLNREKRQKSPSTPRFTIAQIKRYLNGKRLFYGDGQPDDEYNTALDLAISCLGDRHDGIGAELKRDRTRKKTK